MKSLFLFLRRDVLPPRRLQIVQQCLTKINARRALEE